MQLGNSLLYWFNFAFQRKYRKERWHHLREKFNDKMRYAPCLGGRAVTCWILFITSYLLEYPTLPTAAETLCPISQGAQGFAYHHHWCSLWPGAGDDGGVCSMAGDGPWTSYSPSRSLSTPFPPGPGKEFSCQIAHALLTPFWKEFTLNLEKLLQNAHMFPK